MVEPKVDPEERSEGPAGVTGSARQSRGTYTDWTWSNSRSTASMPSKTSKSERSPGETRKIPANRNVMVAAGIEPA